MFTYFVGGFLVGPYGKQDSTVINAVQGSSGTIFYRWREGLTFLCDIYVTNLWNSKGFCDLDSVSLFCSTYYFVWPGWLTAVVRIVLLFYKVLTYFFWKIINFVWPFCGYFFTLSDHHLHALLTCLSMISLSIDKRCGLHK